jgi:putative oxidoreductase
MLGGLTLGSEVVIMKFIARKLPIVARVVLGLVFVVFGLNGLLHFLPQPTSIPPAAGAFAGALAASGYFFPLLKITEIAAGALLLAGVFVPFALTLLAPIIVNIAAFHLFLAPGNLALVGLILAAELYLAWTHRAAFAPLFARRTAPVVSHEIPSLQPAHRKAA